MAGAFHQPSLVYINVCTLKTLPDEQFSSGMAEVIKHGLIADKHYFECLSCYKNEISKLETYALTETVEGSCRIKAGIVENDEKESGLRELLNFGHTVGHAIEGLCGFKLPHGHCVALGMIAEAEITCSDNDKRAIKEVISAYGLPVSVPEELRICADDIIKMMYKDKKARGGRINLIVLREIGRAERLADVSEDTLRRAVEVIL
jgi:3-dehydroquinate synthase